VNLISFVLGLLVGKISLFTTTLLDLFSRILALGKFHRTKVLKEQEVTLLLKLQMGIREIVFSRFTGKPFLLPHARGDRLLVEIASVGTAQVLWAHLGSPKAWHVRN
jgi:hypothetical protein